MLTGNYTGKEVVKAYVKTLPALTQKFPRKSLKLQQGCKPFLPRIYIRAEASLNAAQGEEKFSRLAQVKINSLKTSTQLITRHFETSRKTVTGVTFLKTI
jgi:hypothetical protein